MPKKRLLAVVVGVSFLVFAGLAGAAVVTSLPGGSVISMPAIDYVGVGPQTFDGVTWSSTFSNSLFGFTDTYGFASNGFWTGSLGPMAGLNASSVVYSRIDTMTFTFDIPVSGVGGFMNYATEYGTPVIAVYDSSNKLIESYTLGLPTSGLGNSGFFYGFLEPNANIKYFKLSDAVIGITNLTTTTDPVPEPSTMMLLGSGLVGLVGYGRRRFKK